MAFFQSFESYMSPRREVCVLNGNVVLDGSSVPVPFSSSSPSTSSDSPKLCRFVMTRTGVGAYTITLSDKWLKLLQVQITVLASSVAVTAGREFYVTASNVSASGPNLTVQFLRTDTGVAADPTASSTMLVTLVLANAE